MTRSALPWWSYLVGAVWAAVLVQTLAEAAFGTIGSTAEQRWVATVATVLWGIVIGVYRAWPQWCLTFVLAAAAIAAVMVKLVRSVQDPPGGHSGNGGAGVFLVLVLLPAFYGALCALLTLAVGLGVVLSWLWRHRRRSEPHVVVADRRRRLVWLTAAGALWAVAVAVGVALGSGRDGVLWIPLVAAPTPVVLVLAAATVGWGSVIGALREWAEVPVALGLGAAVVVTGLVAAGAVGPGYWGGTYVNSAATLAAGFGLLALALSLGVVVAGGVASLTHHMRRRSQLAV